LFDRGAEGINVHTKSSYPCSQKSAFLIIQTVTIDPNRRMNGKKPKILHVVPKGPP